MWAELLLFLSQYSIKGVLIYNEVLKHYHPTEQNATTLLHCWSAAGCRGLIFTVFRCNFFSSIFNLKQAAKPEHIDPLLIDSGIFLPIRITKKAPMVVGAFSFLLSEPDTITFPLQDLVSSQRIPPAGVHPGICGSWDHRYGKLSITMENHIALRRPVNGTNSKIFVLQGCSDLLPGKVGFGLRPQPPFPGKKELAYIKGKGIFTSPSCTVFTRNTCTLFTRYLHPIQRTKDISFFDYWFWFKPIGFYQWNFYWNPEYSFEKRIKK